MTWFFFCMRPWSFQTSIDHPPLGRPGARRPGPRCPQGRRGHPAPAPQGPSGAGTSQLAAGRLMPELPGSWQMGAWKAPKNDLTNGNWDFTRKKPGLNCMLNSQFDFLLFSIGDVMGLYNQQCYFGYLHRGNVMINKQRARVENSTGSFMFPRTIRKRKAHCSPFAGVIQKRWGTKLQSWDYTVFGYKLCKLKPWYLAVQNLTGLDIHSPKWFHRSCRCWPIPMSCIRFD